MVIKAKENYNFSDDFWIELGKKVSMSRRICTKIAYKKQNEIGKTKAHPYFKLDKYCSYICCYLDDFVCIDRPHDVYHIKDKKITNLFYNNDFEDIQTDELKYAEEMCQYLLDLKDDLKVFTKLFTNNQYTKLYRNVESLLTLIKKCSAM